MMNTISKTTFIAALLLGLSSFGLMACTNSSADKKLRGQVIGGATGAAVGSMFGSGSGKAVAVGAGALLGTVVGGKAAE